MSAERLRRECERWLRQAADDLEAARLLIGGGKHAQAAFLAQQAGEKALKAVWRLHDLDPWGHSVGRLVRDLPESKLREALGGLLDEALALDKLYIPTRYPDALVELTPGEAFTAREARAAVDSAERILSRVRELVG